LDLATARDKDFFRHHLKAVIDLRDPHEYESVAPSSSSVPVHGAYGNAHGLRSRFVRRMRALHRREASTSTNLAPNLVQIKMPEPIEKAVSGEVSDSKQGSGITMPSASATDVETEQQVFRVPLASMKALKKLAWNSATLQEKARFLFTRFVLCRKKESEAIMTRVVGRQGLLGYNRVLVLYSHERVARVLQLIATPGHVPVVFHCTHGKDRTGLVAALVLSILGVAREYVIADYASSAEFIPAAAFKEMLARPGFTAEEWAHSPPLVIMKTLELIDQTYGSVNGYLDAIGFTHEWRERMRSQLLEDTPPPLTPSRAHDEDELKQRAQDHVVHAVAQAVKEAQPALQNAMKDANV
jgi:hypothetical protein